jgi:hypothetical protein
MLVKAEILFLDCIQKPSQKRNRELVFYEEEECYVKEVNKFSISTGFGQHGVCYSVGDYCTIGHPGGWELERRQQLGFEQNSSGHRCHCETAAQ